MDARWWWAVVVLATLPSLGAVPLQSWTQLWFYFFFFFYVAGYASLRVPGYLLVQYLRRRTDLCFPLVKVCVFGNESKVSDEVLLAPRTEAVLKLIFCASGLQVSYLTWSILQLRVMAGNYGATATSPGEHFTDSHFLMLINRMLALSVAGLYCVQCKQPRHGAPILSNVRSSWCQYEALKFVLAKMTPVMMMAKLVSRQSYGHCEYLTAGLVSIGVSMFLLSCGPEPRSSPATKLSGLSLLTGYIAFDSFTSNKQDALFMMFGVNLFSCLFTVGPLLEGACFMGRHSEFTLHALLSICSVFGQIFIFWTIWSCCFRQAIAIILSCLLYCHTVTAVGGLGVAVVFTGLLLRVYTAVPTEPPVQKV
uniref:Adenosine 3'-phospho 5'-phosphosulfate transporter 1 n=1 Tax=Cricetulus griseus TaxID=10029 RepID=A0A8C2QCS2_CRIGR